MTNFQSSTFFILDEEEIKDILGEYYVGINSHRRPPGGGAIAPRPWWRHPAMSRYNRLQEKKTTSPPADILFISLTWFCQRQPYN